MAFPSKHVPPPSGRELRAYHEAGHAVAALVKGFSLTRVSISRRGRVGGACEYRFHIPRAGARSAVRRLARAGAAVAIAGSVAQDAAAAERGWVAVDAATGALFRPFAPGAGDDARVAKRFARRIYRSREAQRAFLLRMRSSTEALLRRPDTWTAVRGLARSLLQTRTLCGEHAVESVLRALAAAGARPPPAPARHRRPGGARAVRRCGLGCRGTVPRSAWGRPRFAGPAG